MQQVSLLSYINCPLSWYCWQRSIGSGNSSDTLCASRLQHYSEEEPKLSVWRSAGSCCRFHSSHLFPWWVWKKCKNMFLFWMQSAVFWLIQSSFKSVMYTLFMVHIVLQLHWSRWLRRAYQCSVPIGFSPECCRKMCSSHVQCVVLILSS